MAILLVSTTIPQNNIEELTTFTGRSLRNFKTAYIPTAANPYKDNPQAPYPEWVQDYKSEVQSVFGEVVEFDIADPDCSIDSLREFDAMYVGGGNVFYLIEQVRQNHLMDIIKDFMNEKIYIGGSAGACILSQNLKPYRYVDDHTVVSSPSDKGLGLINYNVIPHWGEEKYADKLDKMNEEFQQHDAEILRIRNGEGVLINNGNVKQLS